jgi:hypothetical protein
MRIWVPYNMIGVNEGLTGNSKCRSKGQSVPDRFLDFVGNGVIQALVLTA